MGNPHEHARALEGLQKARGAGEERALSKDDAKDFSTSARFFRKLQDEASGVAKQVARAVTGRCIVFYLRANFPAFVADEQLFSHLLRCLSAALPDFRRRSHACAVLDAL